MKLCRRLTLFPKWKVSNMETLFQKVSPFRLFTTEVAQTTPSKAIHQVFIGNIPLSCSEEVVLKHLESHTVSGFSSLRLVSNTRGKFRGFGYLEFPTEDAAAQAVEQLTGTDIDERMLRVDLTGGEKHKGRRTDRIHPAFKVFIGNLPFKLTAESLETIIRAEIGQDAPIKIDMHSEADSASLGYCHVSFGSTEVMNTVLERLNGMEIQGRTINVEQAVPPTPGAIKYVPIEQQRRFPDGKYQRRGPPVGNGKGNMHSGKFDYREGPHGESNRRQRNSGR